MQAITQTEFLRLVRLMKQSFGIDLSKQFDLIDTRLSPLLNQKGMDSLGDFLQGVEKDLNGPDARLLVARLTTNYTYFMREMAHYEFMSKKLLPKLITQIPDHDLRIWSAGCSSGEEAFSTVMVLDEVLGAKRSQWDAKILATDISENALKEAVGGVFSEERLQKMPPALQKKYFTPVGNGKFLLKEATRKEVVFRRFNLMEAKYPFKKKFHVIFCRNVLIYFDKQTTDAIIDKFHGCLEPGGHLFVSLAEAIDKDNKKFKFVEPSIYQKV